MRAQIDPLDEKILDSFAGGGGTSTGIELAIGRPVDWAINHDPDAILMHKTNHPHTTHYCESVWDVDPRKVCAGSPVGLAWFSPDCKHFSKAKGGKPVDKDIRGLAWVALRWAGEVRPRVIILENVEEFQTWGPVRRGKPIKSKAGQTFRKFVAQLRALGYTVEWCELVAADYGAPTTRKRFFLIARCDGRPIVWPAPTHAPRDSEAVRSGALKPWRSAAEIIDWTLPCPSIFATKEDIKRQYGLKAQRPLAPNTQRRVIRGIDKFVINAAQPFIVPVGYGEREGQAPRIHDIGEPLPTSVGVVKHAVCEPVLSPYMVQTNHSGGDRMQSLDEPMQTITAKHGYGIANPILSPLTITNTCNSVGTPASDPVHTVTTAGNQLLVVPTLTAIGQTGGGDRNRDVRDPIHTTVSKQEECLVAANLIQYHTEQSEKVRGQAVTEPIMTIDASPRYGLALANLAKFKGQEFGSSVDEPLPTVTAGGLHHAAVVTTVVRATPGADLGHWSEVRALLNEHCRWLIRDDEVLLLRINGAWYFISDIGLRMLTPRELYAANGFPPDYIIDRDYLGNEYKKTKQVARCGNAVPPPFATALVRTNLPEWCDIDISTMQEFREAVAV